MRNDPVRVAVRRSRRAVALLRLTALAIVLQPSACKAKDGSSDGRDVAPAANATPAESGPTDTDLIEAVRKDVEAKTYTVSTNRTERRPHSCSQFDVDRDPHMPRNPELARCPRVGATYFTMEVARNNDTRKCDPLPNATFGWHVESIGDERWRVTHAGSAWDVVKLAGEGREAGTAVRVANFTFRITASQSC